LYTVGKRLVFISWHSQQLKYSVQGYDAWYLLNWTGDVTVLACHFSLRGVPARCRITCFLTQC